MKDNLATWIVLLVQIVTLIGGILIYVLSLPKKSDLLTLEVRVKEDIGLLRVELRETRKELKEDIGLLRVELKEARKELKEDIDALNQNYINHLAQHIDKPKP